VKIRNSWAGSTHPFQDQGKMGQPHLAIPAPVRNYLAKLYNQLLTNLLFPRLSPCSRGS